MRQEMVTIPVDMGARMRCLPSSPLILIATVVLPMTGCYSVAGAPEERMPGDRDSSSHFEDVAAVVVTAERPDWLMPEVAASANLMPEVAAHVWWASAVPSALPSSDFVN